MKTMLFVVCVVVFLCSFTTACDFVVTGLNGPYDMSSEYTDDVWLDDGEESRDANGESGELDYSVLDVAEMANDSSDDELGMPEIPDIPDIADTNSDPPDVPDVWPDVPDVQDINKIGADETSQEVHEVSAEVEVVEIIEVFDRCNGVDCNDDNNCTDDFCLQDTGECVHDAIVGCCLVDVECVDDDVCNGVETCNANKCVAGQKLVCDDDNVCTDDACAPSEGCVYVPNEEPCDDNDPCTINDACLNKVCAGKLVPCECQSTSDCAKLEDGNLCNGTLKCVQMVCVIDLQTVINCADNDPCTDDSCKPDTGKCVFINNTAPCSDGDKCTTGDTCFNGICQSGADVLCDDNNVCTSDYCDQSNGKCVYTPKPYDDSNPCTIDSCDPIWGESHLLKDCNDNNVCTTDVCNPSTGFCVKTTIADCCNLNTECDNADKCDGAETCVGHKCVPGAPLVCDDGNECTGDICVPAIGCMQFNLPNGTTCDDKDACTNGDTCQTGKCKGGPGLICEDDNPCTVDSCDPANGCTNTPTNEGQKCGDADVCNGVETCANGLCTPGTPLICDDGNECTADECAPMIGCINTEIPDCCIADMDCDGIANDKDNCPDTSNADQADMDKDDIGDVCDKINTCNLSAGGIPSVFSEHNPVCISGCFVGSQIVCIKCISMNNTCIGDSDGTSGSICQGDCNDSWYGQAYECWPGGQPPQQCKLPWTPQ